MKIEFEIPGEPVAKARPRVTSKGFAYTPAKTKNYENWVKMCFMNKYKSFIPVEGRLKVKLLTYFEIPKSVSQKKKLAMMDDIISPTKKPDTDNIAKAVLDSLNGIAYADDKQIVGLLVHKYYSDRPRVEVEIQEF
jgi:Holliday junction resolvase RusA-like endonuclease